MARVAVAVVERTMAALVLALLAGPLALVLILVRGARLVRRERVGRGGVRFAALELELPARRGRGRAARWPALWNVVRGEMALVGPRPVAPGALDESDPRVVARSTVRPGLVSLWDVRRRANIDFDGELDTDAWYVAHRGPLSDLGLLARAALTACLGERSPVTPARVDLMGLPLDNLTMDAAVEAIIRMARERAGRRVAFVNADCVNIAFNDPQYRRAVATADLRLADGIGLKLAGRVLRQQVRQNVNGTDLFPRLCARLAAEGLRPFLLGARPGVATRVAERIEREHPGLEVAGHHHGYFGAGEEAAVVEKIARSGADVLLVAFGAPRQDTWIAQHLPRLSVGVALGVGGLFDFQSGAVRRAPQWVRELGLEWAFRLAMEPRRLFRRYVIGNAIFLGRLALWCAGRSGGLVGPQVAS